MAVDLFYGLTEAELVEELRLAQRELMSGQSLSSVSAGGSSTSGVVQAGITDRIRMILRALNKLNPTDYPSTSTTPDTVTKICFS